MSASLACRLCGRPVDRAEQRCLACALARIVAQAGQLPLLALGGAR